ncbi:nucleosomal binding [Fusarium agapanthi]|uniref:Nucleosomal binding n=1 Tax=Fusarium agapanthi TaxID=1803897 RepID=A0A9P5BCT5_9HYPO|nr:nucleosomal binding [Fusarium agapanthi]
MPSDTPSEADSTAQHQPPASHRTLRLVAIASFLPAFPLCIAHGVLSNDAAPAVGLAPLAFSSGGSLFLLRRRERDGGLAHKLSHPVMAFGFDVVLAAACMIVLVFTWISNGQLASLSMLAAYATIPLLVNFYFSVIHLVIALESFYTGLAVHSIVQWLAWRTLPPDCPHCDHRLRPDFPELPWLDRLRERRDGDYSALFVDEENRYQDDETEETLQRAESAAQEAEAQPEVVDVRKKNNRRNRTNTPPSRDEPASPWSAS